MDETPAPVPADQRRPPWIVAIAVVLGAAVAIALVVLVVRTAAPDRLTVAEYEEAVISAHRDAATQIAGSPTDAEEIGAAVDELIVELDALAAPKDAEDAHDALVEAYREHADVFDDVVEVAAAAKDAATDPSGTSAIGAGLALLGSGRAVVAAKRDLDRARDALADVGVDVFTLADPDEVLRELA